MDFLKALGLAEVISINFGGVSSTATWNSINTGLSSLVLGVRGLAINPTIPSPGFTAKPSHRWSFYSCDARAHQGIGGSICISFLGSAKSHCDRYSGFRVQRRLYNTAEAGFSSSGDGACIDQVLPLHGPYIKNGYVQVNQQAGLGIESLYFENSSGLPRRLVG